MAAVLSIGSHSVGRFWRHGYFSDLVMRNEINPLKNRPKKWSGKNFFSRLTAQLSKTVKKRVSVSAKGGAGEEEG